MSIIQNVLFGMKGQPGAIIPVANFSASATSITQSNTVNFTDTSTVAPGGQAITSWTWSFAGGTPTSSNSQNPSVVYNQTGSYNVSLTVANPSGSDTETKTNYIFVTSSAASGYVTSGLQQYIDPFRSTRSGNTISDLSGNNYPADAENGIVTGSDGWILNVNESEGNSPFLTLQFGNANWPNGQSWEVWFRTDDTLYDSEVALMSNNEGAGTSGVGSKIYVTNSSFNVRGWSGGNIDVVYADTGNNSIGDWHHYIYTINDGDGPGAATAKIYVDGVLISSSSNTIGNISSNVSIRAGGSYPNVEKGWNDAYMGLTRVYDRELSAAEVLQNYNANKADYGL
jgi:PKD repeat protein